MSKSCKTSLIISDHAKLRFQERTTLTKNEQHNITQNAYKHGHAISRFVEPFFTYLNERQLNGHYYSVRVYDRYIFVFDNQKKVLVTIYPIPDEYLPIENFLHEHSTPTIIMLVPKDKSLATLFVMEGEKFTEDIAKALEFKNREKALNYIKNNYSLRAIEERYDLVCI